MNDEQVLMPTEERKTLSKSLRIASGICIVLGILAIIMPFVAA